MITSPLCLIGSTQAPAGPLSHHLSQHDGRPGPKVLPSARLTPDGDRALTLGALGPRTQKPGHWPPSCSRRSHLAPRRRHLKNPGARLLKGCENSAHASRLLREPARVYRTRPIHPRPLSMDTRWEARAHSAVQAPGCSFMSAGVVYGVADPGVAGLPWSRWCRRELRRPPRDPSKWLVETKESEVAVGDIVPVPGAQFEETLASASPDVLRAMIREFAQR